MFLRGISLAKVVEVGVTDAAGDPGIVVVLAQQDVAGELFVGLKVRRLAFGSTEMEDGATKALLTVVLDVFEEFLGRTVVVTPVGLGSESFLFLVDPASLAEGESLLADIGSTVCQIFNNVYEPLIRKVLGDHIRLGFVGFTLIDPLLCHGSIYGV